MIKLTFARATLAALVGLAPLLAASPQLAFAATIERLAGPRDLNFHHRGEAPFDYRCTLRMTGEIAKGDSERLAALVPPSDLTDVFCLEGPGGRYAEGLRLAKVIHAEGILTRVMANTRCLSACAIAFMGGTYNAGGSDGLFTGRTMDVGAQIGFHRPAIETEAGRYDASQVEASYELAIEAIRELIELRDVLTLPVHLVAALLSHGQDSFEYIDTVDELGLYKIGLVGYAVQTVDRQGVFQGCWNVYRWKDGNLSEGSPATADDLQGYPFDDVPPVVAQDNTGRAAFSINPSWTEYCRVSVEALQEYFIWDVPTAEYAFPASFDDPAQRVYFYPTWSMLPGATPISAIPRGTMNDLSFHFLSAAWWPQ